MKILFVSHYQGINGAPKSMISLICKLREKGIQFLVTIPNHGPLEDELKRHKIPYCIIVTRECFFQAEDKNGKIRRWFNELYNFKAVIQMTKLIRAYNPDIVHSNSYAIDVGAFAACLTGKPHIWHFREFMKDDFGYLHNMEWKDIWLAKKSSAIIAVSKTIKEYYEKREGLKNICVVYNGIEEKKYRIDRKTLLDGNKLQLLISGTISKGKGQKDAIIASKILYEKGYRNFQLSIVGDGNTEDVLWLKRMRNEYALNQYVKFYGFQNDLVAFRKNMDVELVCSAREAFGRVTIEAMMADMLVIGADTGGTRELIKDGVNGVLYQQGNPNDLADKIEHVIQNREKYVQCVKNGKEYAMHHFDISTTARKVLEIYQRITRNIG